MHIHDISVCRHTLRINFRTPPEWSVCVPFSEREFVDFLERRESLHLGDLISDLFNGGSNLPKNDRLRISNTLC